MPSAVKDREYPQFLFADDVIDSIELEAMYRRPAHVRKSDSNEAAPTRSALQLRDQLRLETHRLNPAGVPHTRLQLQARLVQRAEAF